MEPVQSVTTTGTTADGDMVVRPPLGASAVEGGGNIRYHDQSITNTPMDSFIITDNNVE